MKPFQSTLGQQLLNLSLVAIAMAGCSGEDVGLNGGHGGTDSGPSSGAATSTGGTTSSGVGGASGGLDGNPATGGSTATGGATATGGLAGVGADTATGGDDGVGSGGETGTGGAGIDLERFRLIWSTDFPDIKPELEAIVNNSDPDDVQSIVRLILYSNELDIEGYIASAGTYGMVANKKNFDAVWDRYEQVYDKLKAHDPKYPSPASQRAITFEGKGNNNGVKISWGCGKQSADSLIGSGKESEASKAIIAAADKPDPRPLWIGVAGGPREVAQAIWNVRNERTEAEAETFIAKLRVFLIACQDGTHDYIMNVPDLFVVESKKTYQSFFCGGGSNCNRNWVKENVINKHGPLGAIYPPRGIGSDGVCEGDSPAFMHLISHYRGINDAEIPSQPGWGGQYKQSGVNHWLDGSGASMGGSARDTYQAEFAERANWMVE